MQLNSEYALANAIRGARKDAGPTQQQVADRSGMSRVWLARLERGDANVKLNSFLRVAAVLGITLEATWDPEETSSTDLPRKRPLARQRKALRGEVDHVRPPPVSLDEVLARVTKPTT